LIDFEGFGFSGGKRISGLTIEAMHRQVTSLLTQVRSDLPLFLKGHSMGCMVLNTYLALNPEIAQRLAGVIWSAPFWGIPDFVNVDFFKKQIIKFLALHLEEFTLASGMPLHKVTRNKQFMRHAITQTKANPLSSLGLQASFLRAIDRIHANAKNVTYPYILVLGDKDVIVNNNMARAWHAKTASKVKQIRLMAGAYHELSKEPNNHVLFEATLKFMGERLVGAAPEKNLPQPFGDFKHQLVKYYEQRPILKRRKFWIILTLVVGAFVCLIKLAKRLRSK